MFDRDRSVDNVSELLRQHGSRLQALVGTQLTGVWAAWEDSRDEWFADEAVVIETGATNLEIVCWKLSDIMMSWDEIDLNLTPRWMADWGADLDLRWRRDALAIAEHVVGRTVTGVNILEYLHKTVVVRDPQTPSNVGRRHEAWLLHAVEVELETGVCVVFNDLDKNGVGTAPETGPDFRRVPVG
jgi:hypothetical protein